MMGGLGYTPGAGATIATEQQDVVDGTQDQQLVQVWSKMLDDVNTPTVSTSAFSDGMSIGGLYTIAGAARAAGGACKVQAVSLIDLSTVAQAPELDVMFFNDSVTAADHTAWSPSTGDRAKFRGGFHVAAADWTTEGLYSAFDIGLVVPGLVATSLYAVAIARGTPTFSGASVWRANFTVERL